MRMNAETNWTFLWGLRLPAIFLLLLFVILLPTLVLGTDTCLCKCTQAVYDTTTRRTFCGDELRRFGGVTNKGDCYYKCVLECPDDGPGDAIVKNLCGTYQYCALDCHGKRNPNNCDIVIHKDRSVAENSYNHLYRGGLPPSHVNKTGPK
jgi:hypothetical protein